MRFGRLAPIFLILLTTCAGSLRSDDPAALYEARCRARCREIGAEFVHCHHSGDAYCLCEKRHRVYVFNGPDLTPEE